MASIRKRAGRRKPWEVTYDKPTVPGEPRRQGSASFVSYDEAEDFAASMHVELRTGTYVDRAGAKVLFGVFAAEHVGSIERPMRPTTRARLRDALRTRVLPAWEAVPLGAIDHTGVQRWLDGLDDAGLAPATVHKTYLAFRSIITAAIDARVLPDYPWGKLRFPKIERHEARFLEPEEVDRLADAIGPELASFVYVGALCGLRAGELFGLRWRDVDFDRRTIEVANAITEAGGYVHEGPPKTAASRRRVPMPGVVVDALELHQLGADDPANGYVWPNSEGRPRRGAGFRNRVWKPACAIAGLDGLVIHELRHTAVAAWIEAGADPTEVAARAGHRSVVTVLDRYGHRFARHAGRVNDALDALYAESRARRRKSKS